MAILNHYFYDPDFSPTKKEIDRGEYRNFGYVIGDEASKTVLYIFQDRDLANIAVFSGKDSVSFKDSQNVTRVLERKTQDNQMVFCYKYEKDVPSDRVRDDLYAFVNAIQIEIDKYIEYCEHHYD